jgi:hypothetical protein
MASEYKLNLPGDAIDPKFSLGEKYFSPLCSNPVAPQCLWLMQRWWYAEVMSQVFIIEFGFF